MTKTRLRSRNCGSCCGARGGRLSTGARTIAFKCEACGGWFTLAGEWCGYRNPAEIVAWLKLSPGDRLKAGTLGDHVTSA